MPKVTLIQPATYKVAGLLFKKAKETEVPIEVAVYLRTRQNFDVDMGELTAQDIQAYMFKLDKPTATKPHDPEIVINQIRVAVTALDMDDKTNLTKDGRLDCRSLSRILGYTVTVAERDEALGDYEEDDEDEDQELQNNTLKGPKSVRLRVAKNRAPRKDPDLPNFEPVPGSGVTL